MMRVITILVYCMIVLISNSSFANQNNNSSTKLSHVAKPAASQSCCRDSFVHTTQTSPSQSISKYKGKSFALFASDDQLRDKNFPLYASALVDSMKKEYGVRRDSNTDATLKVFLHYNSESLPFIVDRLDSHSAYMAKSCLHNGNKPTVASHVLLVDVVDSKTGKVVFSGRSTLQSVAAFKHVAQCIINATIHDVGNNHAGRVSLCSCSTF